MNPGTLYLHKIYYYSQLLLFYLYDKIPKVKKRLSFDSASFKQIFSFGKRTLVFLDVFAIFLK